MIASYRMPLENATYELVEKKSRFIGSIAPVTTERDAIAFIESVRADNRTARHNVYAYIVRENDAIYTKYSDDGEPSGTAGVPVLNVLLKNELTNVVVVVTRYFGGILLGASGLLRAYSASASGAVSSCRVVDMYDCMTLSVTVNYTDFSTVQRFLSANSAHFRYKAHEPAYAENVIIDIDVCIEDVEIFCNALTDATDARCDIKRGERAYKALSVMS